MPTVSVKGREIGYEEVGVGEPLILIHGAQSGRHPVSRMVREFVLNHPVNA